jgi:uncharacterized protein YegL
MTLTLKQDDFFANPSPRLPVAFVLDTSTSMGGRADYPAWVLKLATSLDGLLTIPAHLAQHGTPTAGWVPPINELQQGLSSFYNALLEDEIARWSVELCVVGCGRQVAILDDFGPIDQATVPTLVADGPTPLGEAINVALDALEQRKTLYQQAGLDYYQPWLVIMTDGRPTDSLDRAEQRIRELCKNKRITIFALGIGADADLRELARVTPARPPLRLQGLRFQEFFQWLSASVEQVSASQPGDTIKLDLTGIAAWGEL